MSKKNDGGPAFPVTSLHAITGEMMDTRGGMSLRDYFAAKAMAGLLASDANLTNDGDTPMRQLAVASYLAADAMLEVRDA